MILLGEELAFEPRLVGSGSGCLTPTLCCLTLPIDDPCSHDCIVLFLTEDSFFLPAVCAVIKHFLSVCYVPGTLLSSADPETD